MLTFYISDPLKIDMECGRYFDEMDKDYAYEN